MGTFYRAFSAYRSTSSSTDVRIVFAYSEKNLTFQTDIIEVPDLV